MKTLLSFVLFAVPFALVLAPLPFEIAAALLFTGGFVGLAVYDYTHARPALAVAPTLRGAVRRHRQRLALAG